MSNLQKATLGGGCFWCTEAVFQRLKGVEKVVSGYAGGEIENPTYEQICTGRTGHAEVIQISFDANIISFEQLLEVFWHTHNPTTLNQQGADRGTQYRSVIFYHDDEQKQIAEASLKMTDATDLWSDAIVTEISPLPTFYDAEKYHQDYYNSNPYQGYCMAVITPKLQKLYKSFDEVVEK